MHDTDYLNSPRALVDLGAINDHFIENFIRNDVASHDRLLHPRFMVVNANGSLTDRATYLQRWATGFDPDVIVYWDVRDERITLVGNVGLVRSTNKQVVRRDGRDIASMSIYTDTYIFQDGQWRCIQAQITGVAPQNEPGDETIKTIYLHGIRQGPDRSG
ncbi:MAG: nuclear transport factor 2 family protein [Erythrobacter sp.]|nr:nuclear transport factor 2 family protein [Erythrobacter sp.]